MRLNFYKFILYTCLWSLICQEAICQFENVSVRVVDPGSYIFNNLRSNQYTYLTPVFNKTLQASNGVIYHKSTVSIVAGNGNKWIEINTPNLDVIRDFVLLNESELIVLTQSDLGIFQPIQDGTLQYKSLLNTSYEDDFVQLLTINNRLYIRGDSLIYSLDQGILSEIMPNSGDNFIIPFNNVPLIVDPTNGINNLLTKQLIVPPNNQISKIEHVIGFEDNLLLTGGEGIFLWKSSSKELEKINRITNIKSLLIMSNGSIVVGTYSEGLFFLSQEGRIIKTLTKNDGLPSNSINGIYEDQENGIWIDTNNGLARIQYLNPVRNIFKNIDHGIVISLGAFRNSIYAGTTEGLFKDVDKPGNISKIEGIDGYVFSQLNYEDNLIIGSSKGIFQLDSKDRPTLIIEDGARELTIDPGRPGIIYAAQTYGIGIYLFADNRLEYQGTVKGLDDDIRGIGFDGDNNLLVAAARSPIVYHIENPTLQPKINRLDSLNGIISTMQIFQDNNSILYGSQKGLLNYDFSKSKFLFDPTYGNQFVENNDAYRFFRDANNQVWISSNGLIHRIAYSKQSYVYDTTALIGLPSSTYRSILVEESGKAWMGGDDGLFVFDPALRKNPNLNLTAMIAEIRVDYDSLVYDGINNAAIVGGIVPHINNDISFAFSAPSFDEGLIEYSFQLEGYDDEWSGWSQENRKEYTNLYEGSYIFKVRSKTPYSVASIASVNFTILPPWYRTVWAYISYVILIVTIGYIAYKFEKKRFEAKQGARLKAREEELRKEREISEKLRMVDKLKDDFLANTSHELRTPLNGIIGISESLIDTEVPPDSAELKNNLSLVVASGKRLASMVDGILDYSKLRTANLELYKRTVDLKSLTEVVASMSRPLIKGHPVEIINALPDKLPQAWADENRVQQIMYNLIGNAIKFTERGTITISAKIVENKIEVQIEDTGVGIPEEKIDAIFESYEQLSESVDRDYIGTGLGLTITKKLIELHDGRIWVKSVVDKGSSFFFTLPISSEEIAPVRSTIPQWTQESVMSNGGPRKVKGTGLKILVVDDEPVNQKVLSNILEAEGFQLTLASNGEKALELLDEANPDLVLLDIMMPKMSGYEVCEKIRNKRLMSELPVIFITAKNEIKDLVEGLSYGANDYVTKPFSKEEFLARVNTHLNLYKINDSYSRFVPHEFLRLLNRDSIIDVNLGDQIEKTVTILFSDIRGYTSISERMTPKENFNFLNRYLKKVGPAIGNNNGFISHYYGDGIMALFSQTPEDALKASLEIVAKVREFNKKIMSEGMDQIKIGIGLHAGPSMLGILGDKKRMDASLVSDSVNIASRMEGLTKFYSASIIVSESTLQQIENKDEYLHRFLGKVVVKGKSRTTNVIEIFEADEEKARALKLKTRPEFEVGIMNYLAKNFTEAAANFKKVIGANPDDAAAKFYLKNSAKFMVEGVPNDWKGIENIQFK